MKGTLYRYPHPQDSTKFLYIGQGPNRDRKHRSGESSFGRRFKKLFPNDVLPQPIKEEIDVNSHIELNEEEIIWMFRYHTWRGYLGGMNLTLPGSSDYKKLGLLGGAAAGPISGRKAAESGQIQKLGREQGRKNVKSGHIQALGREQGRKNVESGYIQFLGHTQGIINFENGHLANIRTPEHQSEACRKRNEIYGNPRTHEGSVKGGRISGRKAVESGHIQALGKVQGYITCCLRWNIRRGKPCTCGRHLSEK